MVVALTQKLSIVEPVPIQDTICSAGLILVQDVGYGARFVIGNVETAYEVRTEQIVVVGKIVLPWDVIWPSIGKAVRFMTGHPMQLAAPRTARLRG